MLVSNPVKRMMELHSLKVEHWTLIPSVRVQFPLGPLIREFGAMIARRSPKS